jgi:hypothetical protein
MCCFTLSFHVWFQCMDVSAAGPWRLQKFLSFIHIYSCTHTTHTHTHLFEIINIEYLPTLQPQPSPLWLPPFCLLINTPSFTNVTRYYLYSFCLWKKQQNSRLNGSILMFHKRQRTFFSELILLAELNQGLLNIGIVTMLRAGRMEYDFRQVQKFFCQPQCLLVVKLTIPLHLVPRLRMNGVVLSPATCVFMALCLFNHLPRNHQQMLDRTES